MEVLRCVQIHQYNDPEILEFFNEHGVQYRLLGDHLFIIRSRGRDVAAGPGDRLTIAVDGEVEVHDGDYPQRAQRAIRKANPAQAQLKLGLGATERWDARRYEAEVLGDSTEQMLTGHRSQRPSA